MRSPKHRRTVNAAESRSVCTGSRLGRGWLVQEAIGIIDGFQYQPKSNEVVLGDRSETL